MSQHDLPARRGRLSLRSAFPLVAWLALACLLLPAAALAADPIGVADFRLPPQDQAGWTRLSPASDSRLVYVDSQQGNDATGAIYLPGDPAVGTDPQSPRGAIRAFRTLAAAQAGLREDQPDWLLLRAGRVWNERLDIRRGRSPEARAVVAPWGSGARPELRTGADKGIGNVSLVNVAIVGIRFWAHTRDSAGPHFTGFEGSSGISVFTRPEGDRRQVRDVLIEDCVFRAYSNNVLTGSRSSSGNAPITRFVVRRSIISGNYATGGHAQGMYHVGAGQPVQPAVLLQENLFDHNGWRIQSREGNNAQAEGQATMFNHNTYFSSANGVVFQRNLFLRASSIGSKWTASTGEPSRAVVIDDNLYAEGEIGISIGGNSAGADRFQDVVIRHNVLTDIGRARPTNRSLSWGIEAQDWLGGEIDRNLLVHQRSGIGNTWGLRTAGTRVRDLVVSGNVLANLQASRSSPAVGLAVGAASAYRDNIVHNPGDNPAIRLEGGGFAFSGSNRYAGAAQQPFLLNGAATSLSQWRTATGDQGATTTAPAFPDPRRDLEGYAASLGLDGFDGLLEAMYAQSKARWDPRLTAGAINNWLRAGFGMAPASGQRLRRGGSAPLAPPVAAPAPVGRPAMSPTSASPARAPASGAITQGRHAATADARSMEGIRRLAARLVRLFAFAGGRERADNPRDRERQR